MQREFKISLSQEYYSDPVYLSQYDTDYQIIFHVVDKYSSASGINGLTAKFTGTRKDGLGFTFESTASGSTVSFIINTSLTALAGNAVGEIVFYDADGLYYGSANVQIIIEPAARPEGTIDADVERAQEIAEQIQEIVDNAAAEVKGEAESWAVGQRDGKDVPATDPTYNNNAKYYALQAKQSAESIGIDATLSQAGKAADAKATGDRIDELKSDLSDVQAETIVDMLDLNRFVEDSSSFISTDGYITTVNAVDNRAESVIAYTMPLQANVQYAVVFDNVSTISMRFQIYDGKKSVLAYNGYPTYANAGGELLFRPSADGNYCLKLICNSYPQTVTNLRIVNYDLWRKEKVYPKFISGYTDSQCITHAVLSANVHNFSTVYLPYRSTAYSIEEPIELYSDVELCCDYNAQLTLADGANCQMVINHNATTGTIVDHNIAVRGGIWDGNHDNQNKWGVNNNDDQILVVGFQFAGVNGLKIEKCTIQNARTYGVLIGNATNVIVDDINVNVGDTENPDNSDGVHFLGPVSNVKLINSTLKSEDNVIAFNADDVNHGALTTSGAITNVIIDNVIINNTDGGQGILLLSASNPVRNVIISNIMGTAGYFLNVSNFGLSASSGDYDGIIVTNVALNIVGKWESAITLAGIMDNVTLENINFSTIDWANITRRTGIYIRKFSNNRTIIKTLTAKNIKYNGDTSSKVLYLIHIAEDAIINRFYVEKYISVNNARCYPCVLYGTIDKLTLKDCHFTNLYAGVVQMMGTASSITTLTVDNVTMDTLSAPRVMKANGNSIEAVNISNMIDFEAIPDDMTLLNYPRTLRPISTPYNKYFYYEGDLILARNGTSIGWKCTSKGTKYGAWAANTAVSKYATRKVGDYLLICRKAGTTGNTSPEITTEDGIITDGTVEWSVYHGAYTATFVSV